MQYHGDVLGDHWPVANSLALTVGDDGADDCFAQTAEMLPNAPDAEHRPACSNIAGKHTSEACRQLSAAIKAEKVMLASFVDPDELEGRKTYVYADEHVGDGDVSCMIGELCCTGPG